MDPRLILSLLEKLRDVLDDDDNVEDDHARTAAKAWVDSLTVVITHALDSDAGRKPSARGEDD